jgi:uridylate kinase
VYFPVTNVTDYPTFPGGWTYQSLPGAFSVIAVADAAQCLIASLCQGSDCPLVSSAQFNSTNNGASVITVTFEVGYYLDIGAVDVLNRVQSAIPMTTVCEPYIRRRAIRHMEKGRVVIFAAGTGNPFFTTDTAAALRAAEMGVDAIMKGTQVSGVYSEDPKKNPNAQRFDRLTHSDVLSRDLKVMDASAVALARDSNIRIIVFNIHEKMNFVRVLQGQGLCTVIGS